MTTANQTSFTLKFLGPQWFATVMGLAGLALAWTTAVPKMGPAAEWVARGIGGFAALVFLVLLALFSRRGQLYPEALTADLLHPVRHAFFATITVALILLATLGYALYGMSVFWETLWLLACLLQFAVTVWVLSRWWRGNNVGGFQWPGITPVLIIPVVGNVLAPLAGVPLGQHEWAAVQFGIGAFLWPVLMALIFVRIGVHGMWPDRLLPTGFITVAPSARPGWLKNSVRLAWSKPLGGPQVRVRPARVSSIFSAVPERHTRACRRSIGWCGPQLASVG